MGFNGPVAIPKSLARLTKSPNFILVPISSVFVGSEDLFEILLLYPNRVICIPYGKCRNAPANQRRFNRCQYSQCQMSHYSSQSEIPVSNVHLMDDDNRALSWQAGSPTGEGRRRTAYFSSQYPTGGRTQRDGSEVPTIDCRRLSESTR